MEKIIFCISHKLICWNFSRALVNRIYGFYEVSFTKKLIITTNFLIFKFPGAKPKVQISKVVHNVSRCIRFNAIDCCYRWPHSGKFKRVLKCYFLFQCMHGGLSPELYYGASLDLLNKIDRPSLDPPSSSLPLDLLWADSDSKTDKFSTRGVSCTFGPEVSFFIDFCS